RMRVRAAAKRVLNSARPERRMEARVGLIILLSVCEPRREFDFQPQFVDLKTVECAGLISLLRPGTDSNMPPKRTRALRVEVPQGCDREKPFQRSARRTE